MYGGGGGEREREKEGAREKLRYKHDIMCRYYFNLEWVNSHGHLCADFLAAGSEPSSSIASLKSTRWASSFSLWDTFCFLEKSGIKQNQLSSKFETSSLLLERFFSLVVDFFDLIDMKRLHSHLQRIHGCIRYSPINAHHEDYANLVGPKWRESSPHGNQSVRMREIHEKIMAGVQGLYIVATLLFYWITASNGSLIASSEVQMCSRDSPQTEPILSSGEHCRKKFVVSLAVRNGKVSQLVIIWKNHLIITPTNRGSLDLFMRVSSL